MSDSQCTPTTDHQAKAVEHVKRAPVQCAVLTVSDTRTAATDVGGRLIEEHLKGAGHIIAERAIVKDDAAHISSHIEQWLALPGLHAILITGGTGIAKRDTTIEVVRRFLTHELEGFGELFRMLSYEHVKGAAMLSRATGGLVLRDAPTPCETFIFAMPGSPNAVEVAMSHLIAPQLAHLVWERRR